MRTQNKRVWTIALVGLLAVAVGAGLAGTAAATVDSADRTTTETTVSPGETVEVTLDIQLEDTSNDLRVSEAVTPAMEEFEILDDDGATIVEVANSNDELAASYTGTDEVSLVYAVTIPEDAAPGTEFDFSGTVEDHEAGDEQSVTGDQTVTVSEESFFATELTALPTQVAPGEPIEVEATVTNTGGEMATQDVVIDAGPLGSETEPSTLDPDESTTLEATFETDSDAVGDSVEVSVISDDETDTGTVQLTDVDAPVERSVGSETVAPGESTTVELTATLSQESNDLRVTEGFSPAFADVAVIDDDGATIAQVTDDNDELVASYGGVEQITLEYEVTVPESATEGEEFAIEGTVNDEDNDEQLAIGGDMVVSVGTAHPLAEYADDDGIVTTDGLFDAAGDFRSGDLDQGDMFEIAAAFRADEPLF